MATTTISTAPRRHPARAVYAGIRAGIGAGFAAVMRFLCSLADAHRCGKEAQRLMALSDGELARRGLKRDEIVAYVFRNHMHK